ncbi:3-hydroxyisobutyryl-CoA hydrolase [Coniosporium apollinis]|uniref:3-hydroxyisobutyryl-CoA hydrolase n=1 Tax=Coniosporium apollinis TaxID=61459 RepID=A0ABQ9NLA5_9PEZI|nr:3-hydroxyisobutyryl-CoA hydrolase [Coniosporium apollinis]
MPLRAKILNPAVSGNRSYSMETDLVKPQPGDEEDDVLFGSIYGVRTVELNRPKKLNSLNGSMARKIIARLREWEKSQLANVIVIKGAGRAFCAGGDVAALAKWNTEGPEGQQKSKDYFALEYKLDHLIATYSKPYVAFMDGITMGGGVGLSTHAPFRIATENTVFAMPETTIGFFPDVGASFFLTRMDGNMGTYLALTSEQLKGEDVFYHNIATHFIHSSSLPELEARLAELKFKDYDDLSHRYQTINSTIEEFVTGLSTSRPTISGDQRLAIDQIFNPHRDIKSILSDLHLITEKPYGAGLSDWAAKTAHTMQQRSPTSVLVALKQMRDGRGWNIAETFQREHLIASHFMEHPDFVEGVTARLVRRQKERPNWQPGSFEEVSEEAVEEFFKGEPSLQLLKEQSERSAYREYPHQRIVGLPTEQDFAGALREGTSKEEMVQQFAQQTNAKVGVQEKLGEYLERRERAKELGIKGYY